MKREILVGLAALLICGCRVPSLRPPQPPPELGPDEIVLPDPTGLPLSPPRANAQKDDWIRLKSDEWLRGEIKVLRSGTLKFDSEELDDLDFDFEDIPEIRTTRDMTCVFDGGLVLTGPLFIRDGQVRIGSGATLRVFRRDDLLTLIPGASTERNYWSGAIGLGLNIRSGNTDQEDFNFDASAVRRSPYRRFDISFTGAVSTVNGNDTANNQRGNLKYDHFLNRRLYVTPLWLQYYRDIFQNIASRWSPGVGVGYYFYDVTRLEWTGDLGFGYQFTKQDSVGPGEDDSDTEAFGRVGTFLDAELTSKTDLEFTYSLLFPLDSDNYNQHLDFTISTDLWGDLDLDVTFTWDRQGDPEVDSSGITPKKDDYRTMIGFSWEF